MTQILRVRRGPTPKVLRLPQDRWHGRTYVTAEGTALESIWSGRGKLPWQGDWPIGVEKDTSVAARIHLPRTR